MNLGFAPSVIDVPGILGADRAAPRLAQFLVQLVDNEEIQAPLDLSLVRVMTPRDRLTDANAAPEDSQEQLFEIQHPLDAEIPETVKAILAAAMTDMERGFDTRTVRQTYSVSVDGRPDRIQFTLDLTGHRAQMTAPRRRSEYMPDLEGLASQQMDVNLQLIDRLVDMSTSNLSDKDRTIADLRSRNERLERVEFELRRRIEQLMDGTIRRNMMTEEFERDQKRKDDYAEGFKQLAPSVVAWAMGPQAGHAAALVTALTQAGPGALGAIASGVMPGAPGMAMDPAEAQAPQGPPQSGDALDRQMAFETYHHIDGFIGVLEARPEIRQSLMRFLLTKAPECVAHLHALHQGSLVRRQSAGASASPASPGYVPNGANTNGQAARRG